MKELSIEEKAKAYDEAIKVAKSKIKNDKDHVLYEDDVIEIFPELKESEGERIRKGILHLIGCASEIEWCKANVSIGEVQTWLEKQCKQETDEWKEGNIIRHGDILALVIKGRRAIKSNGELFTVQYPNEWVKAVPNEIERFLNELEKQGEQNLAFIEKGKWYVCIRTSYKPNGKDFIEGKTYYAKEDYKIIGECGEVDIATDNPEESFRSATEEETNDIIKNFVNEQKPAWSAWSEEDEYCRHQLIVFCENCMQPDSGAIRCANWLKSIKDRIQPQSKQEWSEENEKMFEHIIAKATLHFSSINYLDEEEINFLKSLRPQPHWKPCDEQMDNK